MTHAMTATLEELARGLTEAQKRAVMSVFQDEKRHAHTQPSQRRMSVRRDRVRPKALTAKSPMPDRIPRLVATLRRSERDLLNGYNWPGKLSVRRLLASKGLITSHIGSRACITKLGEMVIKQASKGE